MTKPSFNRRKSGAQSRKWAPRNALDAGESRNNQRSQKASTSKSSTTPTTSSSTQQPRNMASPSKNNTTERLAYAQKYNDSSSPGTSYIAERVPRARGAPRPDNNVDFSIHEYRKQWKEEALKRKFESVQNEVSNSFTESSSSASSWRAPSNRDIAKMPTKQRPSVYPRKVNSVYGLKSTGDSTNHRLVTPTKHERKPWQSKYNRVDSRSPTERERTWINKSSNKSEQLHRNAHPHETESFWASRFPFEGTSHDDNKSHTVSSNQYSARSPTVDPYAKTPTQVKSPPKGEQEWQDELERCFEGIPDDALLQLIEPIGNPFSKTDAKSLSKNETEWQNEMDRCFESIPDDALLQAIEPSLSCLSPNVNVVTPAKEKEIANMDAGQQSVITNPYSKRAPVASRRLFPTTNVHDDRNSCSNESPTDGILNRVESLPASDNAASLWGSSAVVPVTDSVNPYAKNRMKHASIRNLSSSKLERESKTIKLEEECEMSSSFTDETNFHAVVSPLDDRWSSRKVGPTTQNQNVTSTKMSCSPGREKTSEAPAKQSQNGVHSSLPCLLENVSSPIDNDGWRDDKTVVSSPLHETVVSRPRDDVTAISLPCKGGNNFHSTMVVQDVSAVHDSSLGASNDFVSPGNDESQSEPQSAMPNAYAKHVTALEAHELAIPAELAFAALFNEETQFKLLDLGLLPSDPTTFDVGGWPDHKIDRLCQLWSSNPFLIDQKCQSFKLIVFNSKAKLLCFPPILISEAFALEFPEELLPDEFFYNPSSKVQVAIREQVHSLRSDLFGKPSAITATGMQQLQPTTDMSDTLFADGRSQGQIDLFESMIRLAISHATQHDGTLKAPMQKKITYLITKQQKEQAPHRDFSKQLLKDHRRLPILPWGLDMPLTSSGLLLNLWPEIDLTQLKQPTTRDESLLLPYTLDISFRQILLFSGGSVHGGGFQRKPADGCFRMHMYLSFAPGRRTHAALEGQDKVELEDDDGVKYSKYLLKSDGGRF